MIIRHSIGTAFILVILSLSCNAHAGGNTGKVVSISDGDTITILDSTKTQHKIRLWGIDCPESHQDFRNKAKNSHQIWYLGKRFR